MEAENEEVPLQATTDVSAASTPTENHNHNKVRRRNVPESAAKADDTGLDRVPLITLPDSTKAWHGGVVPRIPDLADVAAAGKQRNGVLTSREDDHDSATTEAFTSREKMKMSVIRGSIINPDLTLGELRLLGCSSEGFVNGTFTQVTIHYDQQGTLTIILLFEILCLEREFHSF